MYDEEKVGRNSRGRRVNDSQPSTNTPRTAIDIVTRRSTEKRMIGLTFTLTSPSNDETGLFNHETTFLPTGRLRISETAPRGWGWAAEKLARILLARKKRGGQFDRRALEGTGISAWAASAGSPGQVFPEVPAHLLELLSLLL